MTGVAAQMCANPPADILEQFPSSKTALDRVPAFSTTCRPLPATSPTTTTRQWMCERFKREFERIKAAVQDEFDWLYGTEHYEPAWALRRAKADVAAAEMRLLRVHATC